MAGAAGATWWPLIVRTSLRVDGSNGLDFWAERFDQLGVKQETPTVRDGRLTLDFEDPEGQRLALDRRWWRWGGTSLGTKSVPAAQQIRGLGPIVISVPDLSATDLVLQQVMGMRPARTYPLLDDPADMVHVYEMGVGGAGAELHVAVQPSLPAVGQGAGGVHHVAFRSADADYDAWADRLNEMRVPNSGKVDRFWFRSLYFREPNGVLFEIATDGPGFGVDEEIGDARREGRTATLPGAAPDRDRRESEADRLTWVRGMLRSRRSDNPR